jgi:hypothetical protein
MSKLFSLVFALLVGLLVACIPSIAGADKRQTTTPVQAVAVTVENVPPELYPSPTLVICTSMPPNMTLSVEPVSPTAVRLEITGLQPGESLIFILRAQSDGHTIQREDHLVSTADSNGRFVYMVNGLAPPLGTKHWTVQVIHSRGVACTAVDLP